MKTELSCEFCIFWTQWECVIMIHTCIVPLGQNVIANSSKITSDFFIFVFLSPKWSPQAPIDISNKLLPDPSLLLLRKCGVHQGSHLSRSWSPWTQVGSDIGSHQGPRVSTVLRSHRDDGGRSSSGLKQDLEISKFPICVSGLLSGSRLVFAHFAMDFT